MYKVKPTDQIPITLLTEDEQNKRVKSFGERRVNKKSVRLMSNVHQKILSLQNSTVTNEIIIELIGDMYKAIDFFMRKNIYDYAVCRSGCAHCCRVPVQVSGLEAVFISQNTEFEINKNVSKGITLGKEVDYCPLLDIDSARCLAYDSRPMACRIFATIDSPIKCEDPKTSHYIHSFESQAMFRNWHDILIEVSEIAGLAEYADVRAWFNKEKM